MLCRKLLINTRLQPDARGVRREKNRLNGFSWARSWFTALKRGVNEMISTEQFLEKSATGNFSSSTRHFSNASRLTILPFPKI
jgi:hypothetical protein